MNPLGSILSTDRALAVLRVELGERWSTLTLKPKKGKGWRASWKLESGTRCRLVSSQDTLQVVVIAVLEKDRMFR